MSKYLMEGSTAKISLGVLSVLLILLLSDPVFAQRRTMPRSPGQKKVENATEDSSKLAKATRISKLCEELQDLIGKSNRYKVLPYGEIDLPGGFRDGCLKGELSWEATRKFAHNDKFKDDDKHKVTVCIRKLDRQRIFQEGVDVRFFAWRREIVVGIGGNDTLERQWFIDLGTSWLAEDFARNLRNLHEALGEGACS